MIHGSCSDDILETLPEKSNVGRPGTWVFRIDGDSIQSGWCSPSDKKSSTEGGATEQGNGANFDVLHTCNKPPPKPKKKPQPKKEVPPAPPPQYGDMLMPLKNMHRIPPNVPQKIAAKKVKPGNSAKSKSASEEGSEPENEDQ